MNRETISIGDVVKVNIFNTPCVIISKYNVEWVGYQYLIVGLEKLLEIGDFENSIEDILARNAYLLSAHKIRDGEIVIEKLKDEAPFEIIKVPVIFHSCRRKKSKKVTIWE